MVNFDQFPQFHFSKFGFPRKKIKMEQNRKTIFPPFYRMSNNIHFLLNSSRRESAIYSQSQSVIEATNWHRPRQQRMDFAAAPGSGGQQSNKATTPGEGAIDADIKPHL